MINLVRNAFDAVRGLEPGKAREVYLATTKGNPGGVEVSVGDTGGGIDPTGIEQIFDDFYTTKPEGLGLGLSISRSLAEVHGGKLWVETRPGNKRAGRNASQPIAVTRPARPSPPSARP